MLCYASYIMYSIYSYIYIYILYCTWRNSQVRMYNGIIVSIMVLHMIYMLHIICYAWYLSYISSHLQHATPVISATIFRFIDFRWLNWHPIASSKFSVCTQLLLVRVPNGRHMTAGVALSIVSGLVGSNPVLTVPCVPRGLCCPAPLQCYQITFTCSITLGR